MATKYQIPSVYREEVFPAPAPALMTGVPAFLGLAATESFNTPQQLTLWPQFEEHFGQPLSNSYLGYAVRGFFENEGRLCYVVPIKEAALSALQAGLDAIASLDTIDLVCAPDIMQASQNADIQVMQRAVLDHCELLGDRFAILDGQKASAVGEIQQQQQHLSSINGALYAPWLKVPPFEGTDLLDVPPCGHIAGVYARSDRAAGIPQSPANYVLEGVLDLNTDLTEGDIARLYPQDAVASVNCLRALPGRGIRIWGTRTLSQDPSWCYINVRRLFLTVCRWCDRNLANVAFEPNDFKLWVGIERELTAYCESLLQQGALKGETSQEAFYVKCDANTNPPEVQDTGMVVTEIGLAPTIPNEFIIVRLIHGTTGVSLTS
ncbi:phage tail sheath family protein [Anabaena sp. UHCC 0399]|uniref:phage tail sheath family protein n=1 Tax=Anabaena sp. UHCC 0399 TaxID=3110238 RepID=UPI002B1E99B7|nr:phage tail sheath subtilisin-like domain-containing protein [Anabaena sp. UHCC 0399]MEA5567780.1 phage tail sheath subtilisin-like domain-containing protein [Anabaena sp. UHCC 0399]